MLHNIISQIFDGLEHIHQNKITHRDFNVTNILINTQDNKIKIIDFGLSKQITTEMLEFFSPQQGNPVYRPPDFIEELNNVFFDDIWGYCAIAVSLFMKKRVSSHKLSRLFKEYQNKIGIFAYNDEICHIMKNIEVSMRKIISERNVLVLSQAKKQDFFDPLCFSKKNNEILNFNLSKKLIIKIFVYQIIIKKKFPPVFFLNFFFI